MKTDQQLKADVLAELKWEPSLHTADIQVEAHLGAVTLTGIVKHYADKFAAERATQRVEGVRAIAENLNIQAYGILPSNDTEIAESVVQSLRWHVWIPTSILATIEEGWVTLHGTAHWDFQRQAAEDAIRYLTGVKGISNNITLEPSLKPSAVSESIERSLDRNAEIDASQIQVTAEGGRVVLAGSVHSWDERRKAFTAAWNAPGVTYVENNLAVMD